MAKFLYRQEAIDTTDVIPCAGKMSTLGEMALGVVRGCANQRPTAQRPCRRGRDQKVV
jgi:hypothetical protein